MKARIKILGLLAALAMAALSLPASADGAHTTINLNCDDPNPQTVNVPATGVCDFVFNPGGDFGATSNDKTTKFELWAPPGTTVNEDNNQGGRGSDGVTDPTDGMDVGSAHVTTELSYNGCSNGNTDANQTYITEWDDDWNTHAETGWTKVAEYNTVFTILFFFTENVPSHVMRRDSDGQIKVVTDLPDARACDGAITTFTNLTTYAYGNNNAANTWISKNTATSGCHEVKVVAYEVGGTTHTDVDTVDVGGNPGC